jgi:hypothetical protein
VSEYILIHCAQNWESGQRINDESTNDESTNDVRPTLRAVANYWPLLPGLVVPLTL